MYCGGGKMLKKRRNGKYHFRIICIILIIVSILLSVVCYKMHPVLMRYAVSVAETIMLNSANESVLKILEDEDITYDDIVKLTYNDDGYVTSLEIDVYKVNFLKSKISNTISSVISDKEHYDLGVPVGSFFNNDFTNGFGPRIKFKMQVTTTAFVDFSHEFRSAGINQVLHIIKINMNIRGSLVVVGYSKSINTSSSAIAAQTVIVGKSPEAFTNVVESPNDNTGGLINDYGAIAE